MKSVSTISEVRDAVANARAAGKTIGLVPTMGALHAGHASLVEAAAGACGFVVISIFVNPTQFGPTEDLAAYPRTPEKDLELCRRHGAQLVFMPTAEEMYPDSVQQASRLSANRQAGRLSYNTATEITLKSLSGMLCGRSRPTHFAGVCTVVAKLFNIVQPDQAFFGAKDFQQATILRRMAEDLNFPLKVVVCPTVREADGLAMSSRNAYLSDSERRQAPALYQALQLGRQMILDSRPTSDAILAAMRQRISRQVPDGQIDYLEIVDPEALLPVQTTDKPVVIALAVRLGRARLIDNIAVD